MSSEIITLAASLGLIVSSVWDGYTRRWFVQRKEDSTIIYSTNEYDRLMDGLRNGGKFRPL